VLARQALYHLSHVPSPFQFSYFSDRVSHFSPWLASDCNPPMYTSNVAGITGVNHHAHLFIFKILAYTLNFFVEIVFPYIFAEAGL
jgi:hypothetical protein